MKYLLSLMVVLLVAPGAFSLDREAFTFTKYDLKVQVEPDQQRMGVRGTITLRNDSSSPQKNAALQISSSLTWLAIQCEEKPVQFVSQPYVSDIDHTGELSEAIVTLPKEVAPGGSVELTIGYEGVIMLDATRLTRIGLPKAEAIHSDWDQIAKEFTALRGVGYVVWYPVGMDAGNLSEGNDLFEVIGRWKARERNAQLKISLTYPEAAENAKAPAILCNGQEKESESSAVPPSVDCAYEPLGLSTPSLVAGNYEFLEKPAIRVAFRPEHKRNAERFALAADAVSPFVKEWFGSPREKAQVVELLDSGAAPFESGATLLTPLNDTDGKLLEVALVHELTHAAFSSSRPWIYEGVAHFSQAAYREQQVNREAALDFLALHRNAVLGAEKARAGRPKDAPAQDEALISTSLEEFYRSKAAYVWWMLRDMLGEATLKSVLGAYHADEDKEPGYLQKLVETQSKRDLQWFFDDWVYHDRGLPDFRVESAYARKSAQENYLVTITVENLGGAGAEVPVTAVFDGGETSGRVEVRGKSKGVLRLAVPRPPQKIIVNDGSVPETDTSNNVFQVPAS